MIYRSRAGWRTHQINAGLNILLDGLALKSYYNISIPRYVRR
ncbi:hypothetical protein EC036_33850 [Enterobacter cloacae]|uniref:Uncharacterized protein n=1 Tax=Enterobacter cloacae subsp. cloacae (strain ATCC 13047 / DSM 30054 / NBRC 13535 / NCTC 10005 / WDCM 00083 / NCDC 279-56) TaxID=716541 RepID=A0A0H3CQD3_ENTCC|nr:hypothetical protein ECL_03961 [Enterobacter cloacae subsp. cloacae ATCC 13047]AIV31032.1 hypothetical protein EC036_33850 [Enterobacter cloacae]